MAILSPDQIDSAIPHVLRAKGISKFFPGVIALDNVDFSLRAGETHGIVGENGAGKSSLMKVLSGNYVPDQGQVFVGEQPVTLHTPFDARKQGILLIHQEVSLAQNMTVAEMCFWAACRKSTVLRSIGAGCSNEHGKS